MPNTIRLHRVLNAPPERAYRAFPDPQALVKRMPPHGLTAKVHEMDLRVGGKYRMSFTNLTTRSSHSFGGEYLEVVPNAKLRHTDVFEAPGPPGSMTVTVTFKKVLCGTELN